MADPLQILEKELPLYIQDVKNKHSENAKAVAFSSFIQKVFEIDISKMDFEVPTESKFLKLRGRIDAVFENIVIEFKRDLTRSLEEAKDELKKYFQSLIEKFPTSKYIGIANDGIKFKVFQPIKKNGIVTDIEEIGNIDLETSDVKVIFNWFDSYFFTSKKIIPTSEHLKQSFGYNSPTYAVVRQELLELFDKVKDERRVKTKYDNWTRYLEIVYGDKPNEINLFIAHTYLSTFAKLLVYLKLSSKNQFRNYDAPPILQGYIFANYGIRNFVEEDLFTWIMYPSIKRKSSEIFEKLLRDLEIYDLDLIDEDVLKELYQDLIHPTIRKQLGEFYTPDWLAEKIVNEILQENPSKSVLDPSCGSGTFLFKTISYKIKKLVDVGLKKEDVLTHILENVIGFDIHPLAALIAKTNYLLAMRDILHYRRGPITIPVYLSDSLKLPTKKMEVTNAITTFEFDTQIDGKKFAFPLDIVDNIVNMDDVIEKMKVHGHELEEHIDDIKKSSYKIDINETAKNLIRSFDKAISNVKNDAMKQLLLHNVETLFEMIKDESDSIWPYILRNMYKPIAVSLRKVDAILGNPPWIAQQAMKNLTYQNYLKERSKTYELFDSKKIHNIPNLDLATLFFCQCSDIYLRDHGSIGFVMPRSILIGSQHENFLKFKKPNMKVEKIYDLEQVEPLFRIPSCVIFAKKSQLTVYPVTKEMFSGVLQTTNAHLSDAEKIIKLNTSSFEPAKRSTDHSIYHTKFSKGADIIPRCFWFMEVKNNSFLGFDPQSPFVESEFNKNAKVPWNKIKITGNLDKQFLFNSILSTDLIPFGSLRRHLVFLPVFMNNGKIKLINNFNEIGLEFQSTRKILQEIESLWLQHNKEKAKTITAYEWLNYRNKLTVQNPYPKFKVLYVASATYLTSCVIEPQKEFTFEVNNNKLTTTGLIADSTILYYDTNSAEEAHYLSSILNSTVLDQMIKPLQSAGTFGPRHIMKIPLTFPIPEYDSANSDHIRLATISKNCHDKVEHMLASITQKSTGKIRSIIRESLKSDISEINKIVKPLLNA
ncbi:N-6 DNA methylase [Candidatus Nitrosotenuis aquarius]|uniref:N-6 DNA methylase n=1 Tax=Candidatus Nitrosotenuis aquarius TaxID=1846278 RepID=UPI000C1EAC00|nr:N-6 DNA methylase [Candidatus Nitrosotenuis aquarius]